MSKRIWSVLLSCVFFTACAPASGEAPPKSTRILAVFAAASLTDAFTEIGAAFEAAHPGLSVTFNFAGSPALRTQIEEGAQADVFASANTKEMDMLVAGGLVDPTEPQLFLTNQLVVILPADNPAGVESLEALATPGLKLVLAAEEVPVGNYARQSLDLLNSVYGADFKDRVLANVVSNEDNVKQVVAKVQLGEADAGIAYTSDAVGAPDLVLMEIPAELNVIAKYPIASLLSAPESKLAHEFVAYVLSEDGQTTLKKWGFLPKP